MGVLSSTTGAETRRWDERPLALLMLLPPIPALHAVGGREKKQDRNVLRTGKTMRKRYNTSRTWASASTVCNHGEEPQP